MVKKVISFSLIFLIILLIYQYVINGVKNNHFVEYSIEKDKSYRIMENYIKDGDDDYYLFKINSDTNNYVFEIKNKFNKQKNVIEDIYEINQNGYSCIAPIYNNKKYYTYPLCVKDNIVYSYNSVKDELDFSDLINKIEDSAKDKYFKGSSKIDEEGTILNKSYFDDNEVLIIYGYKNVSLHYSTFNRILSFSSIDSYKNTYGTLVGKYYMIPKISNLAYFNVYYKYNVETGEKDEISLPKSISKQSYINGVYNNKLYIFDKSDLKQYEIDPKNGEVIEIGNTENEAFVYKDGKEGKISVYDLNNGNITFSENISEFSNIDYDNIYPSNKYIIYEKDGSYYKVYKKYLDTPIFLFNDKDLKSVKVKYDNIYYIKDETIYKYNTYGAFPMGTKSEFKFNYDNIFDVYEY